MTLNLKTLTSKELNHLQLVDRLSFIVIYIQFLWVLYMGIKHHTWAVFDMIKIWKFHLFWIFFRLYEFSQKHITRKNDFYVCLMGRLSTSSMTFLTLCAHIYCTKIQFLALFSLFAPKYMKICVFFEVSAHIFFAKIHFLLFFIFFNVMVLIFPEKIMEFRKSEKKKYKNKKNFCNQFLTKIGKFLTKKEPTESYQKFK